MEFIKTNKMKQLRIRLKISKIYLMDFYLLLLAIVKDEEGNYISWDKYKVYKVLITNVYARNLNKFHFDTGDKDIDFILSLAEAKALLAYVDTYNMQELVNMDLIFYIQNEIEPKTVNII